MFSAVPLMVKGAAEAAAAKAAGKSGEKETLLMPPAPGGWKLPKPDPATLVEKDRDKRGGASRENRRPSLGGVSATGSAGGASNGGDSQRSAGKAARIEKDRKRQEPEASTPASEQRRRGPVDKDPETTILLLKSVLQISQGHRHFAACLWTTCLVPYCWEAVQAARMDAKNYAARVAEKGKKHDYGPPHPHTLRAFAEKAMGKVEGQATKMTMRS